MGRPAHKFVWFIVFIAILICTARIDYYYSVSDNYRNSGFMYQLADFFGVFPDGEAIMNFKDWVYIHITVLISLIPLSIIRVLVESVVEKCKSMRIVAEKMASYYFRVNVITITAMILLNLSLITIDFI